MTIFSYYAIALNSVCLEQSLSVQNTTLLVHMFQSKRENCSLISIFYRIYRHSPSYPVNKIINQATPDYVKSPKFATQKVYCLRDNGFV